MSDNGNKLMVKLIACSKCGNAYMKQADDNTSENVCENCIKLAEHKRELQLNVMDCCIVAENKMEDSIVEMKNHLTVSKNQFNKQFFLDKIKRRAQALTKSIELIEKIEESNDEKFVEEYQNLFDNLKKDMS